VFCSLHLGKPCGGKERVQAGKGLGEGDSLYSNWERGAVAVLAYF
jgi:hypothetical protein